MNLFIEFNRVMYDLPFNRHVANRKEIAHFCEHDGICICFTQARTTWHALAPCALKPWWLFLNPQLNRLTIKLNNSMRKNTHIDNQQNRHKTITKTAKKAETIEVTENA